MRKANWRVTVCSALSVIRHPLTLSPPYGALCLCMEEVLEAVKGLTSWDAWAKLINASRASPLARSNALSSFNYDEVVVMDGFIEVHQ